MTSRTRPPRLCSCGQIVPHGVPCQCQRTATRQRNARHDRSRPSASARGYDHRWRAARLAFLAAHLHCVLNGCSQPATTVDHIIPHRGDKALFWNATNWQALCTPCHVRLKQRIERRKCK